MPERLRVGLVFGGRSVEHEVSVVSAQHVLAAADAERFELVPIGVTKEGVWLTPAETRVNLARNDPPFQKRLLTTDVTPALPDFGSRPGNTPEQDALLAAMAPWLEAAIVEAGPGGIDAGIKALAGVDVVFPLIHGTHGEDGTLQGLLELLDLPYVGCGVAASAVGMDKALMKTVFRGEGLPIADYAVVQAGGDADALALARDLEERIGYPAFVKPANGGSSIGVHKVRSREELTTALVAAAQHDRKLVIEQAVAGREVECAVLGNADARVSGLGEIRYQRDFYDYEAKYLDPATEIIVPADVPDEVVGRAQALALRAFHALDGAGMGRVDFFLQDDGSLIIVELNTIPGFTPGSMFPRLWQASGVSYSELITRLIGYAIEKHKERPLA